MKRFLITSFLLIVVKFSFSQSLSYSDLAMLVRSNYYSQNALLLSKGFVWNHVRADVTFYTKDFDGSKYSELLSIGSYLTSKKDTIRHHTLIYQNSSLFYMMDFLKQIPDYILTTKQDYGDYVLYAYENSEFYIDIDMSRNPLVKPYSIMMVDKK
ncbi:MAG: hypothetical protein JWP78_3730 [Mucilaginibacter sp.]|nr:hypothetical protein [Mucilaginibacter sp.]